MNITAKILAVTIAPLLLLGMVSIGFPMLDTSQLSGLYSITLGILAISILKKTHVVVLFKSDINFKATFYGFFSIYLIDKYLPYIFGVYNSNESNGNLIIIFISSVILAPLAEEVAFRAGVYEWIKHKYGFYFGMVFSSIIWSACHIEAEFTQFMEIFLSGIILCTLYDKYGLKTVIIIHSLINLYYFF